MLSKQDFLDILDAVKLAPSAHNTQPAKWSYRKGFVFLELDESRCLPIADSENRDSKIGLGASLLGMKIALAKKELFLDDEIYNDDGPIFYTAKILEKENKYLSELSEFTKNRYSHRHSFKKANAADLEKMETVFSSESSCKLITDKAIVSTIAKDHDEASYSFLQKNDYFSELFSWLRLSRSEKSFYKDGLNIDSMGLSFIEKLGAMFIMRPAVFNFFKKIGLGKIVTAEAGKVSTASGILVLLASKEDGLIKRGENFYHSWLLLTKSHMAASPLSTIVDHPEFKKRWSSKLNISSDKEIINILKFGPEDLQAMPIRARLSSVDILKDFES